VTDAVSAPPIALTQPGALCNAHAFASRHDGAVERAREWVEQAGADWSTVVRNVRGAGADVPMFAAALAAGAEASEAVEASGTGDGGTPTVVDLIALAAWRAGAVQVRADAWARMERLLSTAAASAAAATWDVSVADAVAWVEHGREDRWWWQGAHEARGFVAAVGGFAGLGGRWDEPPVKAVPLAEEGAFAVKAGREWWRLDADVCGARWAPVANADPQWNAAIASRGDATHERLATVEWVPGQVVSLVRLGYSYVLWLHVERT